MYNLIQDTFNKWPSNAKFGRSISVRFSASYGSKHFRGREMLFWRKDLCCIWYTYQWFVVLYIRMYIIYSIYITCVELSSVMEHSVIQKHYQWMCRGTIKTGPVLITNLHSFQCRGLTSWGHVGYLYSSFSFCDL